LPKEDFGPTDLSPTEIAGIESDLGGRVWFLIAKDQSFVNKMPWYYPVSGQWNGYSPFESMGDIEITDLSQLPELIMDNEVFFLLLGKNEGAFWWAKKRERGEGGPAEVGFDAAFVIEQEKQKKDVVGFYHTHPNFSASPSSRDDRTMKAWVFSLGKPLVCVIDGIDGCKAWWYINDECAPVELKVKDLGRKIVGESPTTTNIEVFVPTPTEIKLDTTIGDKIPEVQKTELFFKAGE
jgi:proteasome lid subunit RPN8/RPN11